MTRRKKVCLILALAALLIVAALVIVFAVARAFVAQEHEVRSVWRVDVGEMLGKDEALELEICQAALESDLSVIQLVPYEVDEEGFTYYDSGVQDRLAQALDTAKQRSGGWTADAPLAILNPFGTGSNGLYLYFETTLPTQVSYTIHVDDESIPDYTATADSAGEQTYTKEHEFQMIGLVPGKTNQVTLTLTGSWGNVRQQTTFSITMPETHSGYPTQLDYTDGASTAQLSDGLFAMMRTNGYLGYGFFFDNSGVMRYEMVLEGFGLDRILSYGDEIVTCVSSTRLARMDGLGRVLQVYDLDGYELHHDITYGPDNTVVALVNKLDSDTTEDVVIEVDLEEEDSLIVSSRETSTIIKVEQVHSEPQLTWLLGDPDFWADTAYADLSLTPVGDFVFQYGQHSVEYAGAGDEDGVYYLSLYNNNYWSLNTRDYGPELEGSVCRDLYGGSEDNSWVYVYEVDENQGTFTLVESFSVPSSSIVSNAAPAGSEGNWVVNSGVANVFGEYDDDCTMQGYRTFKPDMKGFWFQ